MNRARTLACAALATLVALNASAQSAATSSTGTPTVATPFAATPYAAAPPAAVPVSQSTPPSAKPAAPSAKPQPSTAQPAPAKPAETPQAAPAKPAPAATPPAAAPSAAAPSATTPSGAAKPGAPPLGPGGLPSPAYTYNPEGRRDPFLSLVGRGNDPKGNRPAGVTGLLINEVSIKGIIKDRGGFVAMIQGPDNKAYVVKAGDKLMDGTVKSIVQDAVVFSQDVSDPLSLIKQKEIRKTLRTIEGGRG